MRIKMHKTKELIKNLQGVWVWLGLFEPLIRHFRPKFKTEEIMSLEHQENMTSIF